ncbi:hepatocyte growth factor-regulated tyrosine kinase substrate [Platysternon megacephalum]|uniref:Orexin receptor type 2 n=1 Tax=Platysternon megacephalum TaxID=55544 RepID=A0A4D9EL38_9SAUR|nr:hepatocyte growth factor-regulated tyrosine kinase substrate [Platysternon megacephalum]
MSETKLDDLPSCRNWSSVPQLNDTQESFSIPSADYNDEEFLRYLWREYLHPKEYEWVLIAGYIVIFIVALIGNILVCIAVWKNHHMRTVTNYFIVNLSLADVLVTITCLPATLVVDITETWFFGQTLCKVIPYLQTVSVSVSVLTLSCIALDRWYAICHPLMFKSTAKRARNSIIVIWIVSCIIMIPQAIVMECSSMFPGLANKTILFTVCDEQWGGEVYPKMYHTCFFLVTYVAPLCLMVLAYLQIFRKLWCRQIPGTSSVVQRKWKPLPSLAQPRGLGQSTKSRIGGVAAEIKQIRARRKTARMLMVVLLVFALCYLPISILNVLKRPQMAGIPLQDMALGKFREEFKAAFSCCWLDIHHHQDERLTRGRASTESRKSLTTQISNFDNISKLSEHVMLTNMSTLPANGVTAKLSPLKSVELQLRTPGMNTTSSLDEAERVSVEDSGTTENTQWAKFIPGVTKLTLLELHQG